MVNALDFGWVFAAAKDFDTFERNKKGHILAITRPTAVDAWSINLNHSAPFAGVTSHLIDGFGCVTSRLYGSLVTGIVSSIITLSDLTQKRAIMANCEPSAEYPLDGIVKLS